MMQLGTIGQGPDPARLSHELEQATAGAAAAQVGGGGRFGSGRAPLSRVACRLIGVPFGLTRVTHLTGIRSDGSRQEFGTCQSRGRSVHFDYWFPHVGIAWDLDTRDDGEIAAKEAWCEARTILYYPPGTRIEAVRTAAESRRLKACRTSS